MSALDRPDIGEIAGQSHPATSSFMSLSRAARSHLSLLAQVNGLVQLDSTVSSTVCGDLGKNSSWNDSGGGQRYLGICMNATRLYPESGMRANARDVNVECDID